MHKFKQIQNASSSSSSLNCVRVCVKENRSSHHPFNSHTLFSGDNCNLQTFLVADKKTHF